VRRDKSFFSHNTYPLQIGKISCKKNLKNRDFIRIVEQIGILNYAGHFETQRYRFFFWAME